MSVFNNNLKEGTSFVFVLGRNLSFGEQTL